MALKFRSCKFELLGLEEGRWTILFIGDTEEIAVTEANRRLAQGKLKAVRVMAVRTVLNAFPSGTLIFEKTAPEVVKPSILREAPDGTPLCSAPEDLYGPQSRRAIGLILRDYLTRQQISPTELLHGATHLRRLQDTGAMLQAALHKAATLQSKITGQNTRARIADLDRYVDVVAQKARDFQAASRKWSVPLNGDAAGLSAAVERLVGPEGHDHAFHSLMTVRLAGIRTLGGKLEEVMRLATPDTPWRLQEMLGGIAADLLRFPDVIQDLFGNQRSLSDFLVALIDLLRDPAAVAARIEAETKVPTSMGLLARLLADERLPEGREVLVEWLTTELASEHPLNRHDPKGEAQELARVAGALNAGGAMVGGEAVEQALATRRLIQRQQTLRGQGLHMIADSLKKD
ncbi:hypothetical protein [Nitrospirillum pindoramense]|uniref:Uncharacterized protein n=1 Tax=Nitrospirillum amazonense TaxID=28077 RepID=A0A560HCZ5_9PROT|nr:hypothetical protein [Nitrospirillum amazonense]TWB44246.1 hypothetical protein FBZ90_103152 [Nitrospirillum amazonense]